MLLQDVEQYGNLELLARQVVEGFITGLHNSPNHGFSVEFAEHKSYSPGMNIRNIDWKLFARSDKLFVKQFEEETNLRCRILLDVSNSMRYPEDGNAKLKFSVLATAAICQLLRKQRDAFGLSTFNQRLVEHGHMKSNDRHFINVLSQLDKYWTDKAPIPQAESKEDLIQTLNYIAGNAHRRSLIILFTDMLNDESDNEDVWQALQYLKHGKNEIVLFHVRDSKTELNFEFSSREHRFEHLESEEKLILNPGEIKEAYVKEALAFDEMVKEKCLSYNIDYYPIDAAQDFHQLLLTFYQKRRRMQS